MAWNIDAFGLERLIGRATKDGSVVGVGVDRNDGSLHVWVETDEGKIVRHSGDNISFVNEDQHPLEASMSRPGVPTPKPDSVFVKTGLEPGEEA